MISRLLEAVIQEIIFNSIGDILYSLHATGVSACWQSRNIPSFWRIFQV